MFAMTFAAWACSTPVPGADLIPAPEQDLPLAEEKQIRTAVFAGGCFWCVEAVFEALRGVEDAVSGYAGGSPETANYPAVSTGRTAHAEVVRITYDASRITFGQLLRVHFSTHDPTTLNRQGNDLGPQYRSAIFFANEEEKRIAAAYIRQLDDAGAFPRPIVTTLEPLEKFFPAENYHQDFAANNPDHPYIRAIAAPKLEKLREKFAEKAREPAGDE